jgi:hypothetical protein
MDFLFSVYYELTACCVPAWCDTPGRHTINIQPHTTHTFTNHRPKSASNSAGTEELPEDGTQLPKHVGATE